MVLWPFQETFAIIHCRQKGGDRMNVNVECGKFFSLSEFARMLNAIGADENTFAEKAGCVYFCNAVKDGVKGIACFY